MTDVTNGELLKLARHVAAEAATLVQGRRAAGVSVAATKSSDVDIVTEADRASEELIQGLLRAARPDDGFVGEEGGASTGSSGVRWIVDPIDGTVNFLYGLPQYAVSIAAERGGQVVAGVVRNAATGVEYAATRGGGSTRDGQPIGVRAPAPLARRLIFTGFNYDAEVRAAQATAAARLLPQVRDLRRLGSCALDLCHVAEGSADGYIEEGVHEWDYAAGSLIAEEAGARVAVLTGQCGRPAVVCAPSHGFEEFLSAVRDSGFLVENSLG